MKKNILPLIAVIIVAAAIIAITNKSDFSKFTSSKNNNSDSNKLAYEETEDSFIIYNEQTTNNPTFVDYNSNGTDMQLIVTKTSNKEIRTAFNTCQVCKGSPYAYFEYQNNQYICQNCGNIFDADDIGVISGGCNPIPITTEDRKDSEDKVIISKDFLDNYSEDFVNWKKF